MKVFASDAIIAIKQVVESGEKVVATLIVRNLEQDIVNQLKRRAAKHGRSAEAEHRELLKKTLLKPPRKNFAEVLAMMPNVGRDEDFEPVGDRSSAVDVFD